MKYGLLIAFAALSFTPLYRPAFAAIAEKIDERSEGNLDSNVTGDENVRLRDKFSAAFWGNASGGSLSNPTTDSTPHADGSSSQPQGFGTAYLSAHYAITPLLAVGPVAYFNLYPGQANPAILGDAAISLQSNGLFNSIGLKVSTDLLLFFPASSGSRSASMTATLRGVVNTFCLVPRSRIELGLYGYLQGANYSDMTAANLTASDSAYSYIAPYANYRLTEKLAASLWVDLIQLHKKAEIAGLSNDPVAMKPGISWNVTRDLNLNPYVSVYPGTPTLASTYVGLFVSAKLL